jgi:hypothetical protein
MALLLPPLAAGDVRCPPLDLARERDRGAPHFGELPPALDAAVDVQASRTGSLGPTDESEILQGLFRDQRHVPHLWPRHTSHRIEINAQLVGMLEVVGSYRVRVEVDTSEVDHPDELGFIAHHDLMCGAPRGKAQLDRLDPLWARLGSSLLKERLSLRSVDETLERHRPSRDAAQGALGHAQVEADKVELGVPRAGKEDLVRVADRYLSPAQLQDFLARRHGGHDRRCMP